MPAQCFGSNRLLYTLLLTAMIGCTAGETEFSDADVETNPAEGTGEMSYSPAEFVFTDVEIGVTYNQDLVIQSVGEANLSIYLVGLSESADGIFYMEIAEDIVLAPGTERSFPVTVTMDEANIAEGEIRLSTNDSDNLELRLPITAYPVGMGGTTTTPLWTRRAVSRFEGAVVRLVSLSACSRCSRT